MLRGIPETLPNTLSKHPKTYKSYAWECNQVISRLKLRRTFALVGDAALGWWGQTLDCSASTSPGDGFQAKISAKSNKYLDPWEHPSSAQGRGSFSIPGGWCRSSCLSHECSNRTWLPREQGGNCICLFAVQVLVCCLLDQAFLILYCKLYPPVNNWLSLLCY